MRVAFQEILAGVEANSEARTVRGWKLLLVLPTTSSQEVGGQAETVPGR